MTIATDWLKPLSSDDEARVAMICFPPAGGGMMGYRPWVEPLRGHAHVHAAALPGREHRLREEPMRTIDELVAPLTSAVATLADRPLLVFGHSFGALLAYEVAHRLLAEGRLAADRLRLVVSGRVAPHLGSRTPRLSHLPAREVVFRVAELHRNIPVALLEEPDYVAMLGRALQPDLLVNEDYRWTERAPLPCPVAAVGGSDDPVVSPSELAAWERHAGVGFDCRIVPGDHFYFRAPAGQAALLEVVARCCESLAASHDDAGAARA